LVIRRAERRRHQRPSGCVGCGTSGNFANDLGELVYVLEIPIDRSEADVSHLVEFLQLAHDHFTQLLRGQFALAQRQQFFLDAGNRRLDGLDADRSLAQRQPETGGQLFAVEIDPRAVLLDDLRQAQFQPARKS
jgi:hypothetical protein